MGVMLMKKNLNRYLSAMAVFMVIVVITLVGCAPKATATRTPVPPTSTPVPASTATLTTSPTTTEAVSATPTSSAALETFTAATLAKYDGLNGNPAYVAVDGIVYDVTKVPEWAGGSHVNRFQAGKDYSAEFANAPHNKVVFDGVPVVGTFVK
jgi:predicted heme/steroid binding protein